MNRPALLMKSLKDKLRCWIFLAFFVSFNDYGTNFGTRSMPPVHARKELVSDLSLPHPQSQLRYFHAKLIGLEPNCC